MNDRDVRRAQILNRLRNQHSPVKGKDATEPMKHYVRGLLANREVDEDIGAALLAEVDIMSAYRASQVIGMLKRLPYKRRYTHGAT
jgi:hypothetical protein